MAKVNYRGEAVQYPAFIEARNRQALDAGLAIDKQILINGKLSTAYTGLPEQFISTGWMQNADKFLLSVNSPVKHLDMRSCYSHVYSPSCIFPSIRRWQGHALRMTITRELMPLRVWEPYKGVTAYEFLKDHLLGGVCHTYVAPKALLINCGIAAEHVFENHWHQDYEHEGRKAWLRIWQEDESTGLMKLDLFPENIKWAEQVEKFKGKNKCTSANDWRDNKLFALERMEGLLAVESACQNGQIYSFPDAVRGEIQRHFSELEGLITHCCINASRDPDLKEIAQAKSRFEAGLAQRDKSFKTFLASAMQG